ncbi:MAG: enoyl-CoA hydratase/isomerase family protein [Actinobacteria bacterium]|uniref:3-hydroxyisobutyryl-CoA hydrolase n=1 Tax=Nostocoides veronense TaxID=330836 RepID=A0ABP4Y8Q8_9MICO|nr:enoyl-CoA hydratase/isomerase family protein [Actinomycetota bacterium]
MKTPPEQDFSPSAQGTDEMLYARVGTTAYARLNRPKALNALTRTMVEDLLFQLDQWESDDGIEDVVLDGAGERAFCAGGDVKAVRDAIVRGDHADAVDFWAREYLLDLRLATFPKPVTALMTGYVMGGGLGLSAHVRHRLVALDAVLAMPETAIGMFPDVGITRLFARAPGELGTYAALTGATFTAADAITLGLADELFGPGGSAESLAPQRDWIDECFAGDDAAAIVGRLETSSCDAARACATMLRERSPLAVCATLARVRRAAEEPDLASTLAVDTTLARGLMAAGDFAEGVRAKLIDRDNAPRWRHARIEEVTPAEVDALFA